MAVDNFPPEIHKELGYYVYRLIDPRDGSTFYVGKGKGNRVFDHMKAALKDNKEGEDPKLKRIRDIRTEGFTPLHIVHRHGLKKNEAFLAEAVLIDAISGLANRVGGHDPNDKGPANAEQIVRRYRAETMQLDPAHHVIAINVRLSQSERSLYDAVRFAWRVSIKRAEKADFVFAVTNGICRDVFVPEKWLPAIAANFPKLFDGDDEKRYGFVGEQAPSEIRDMYCGKRLPEEMQRRKGMASPILYSYS